jgi:glycolate oxidase FAD binding subunit
MGRARHPPCHGDCPRLSSPALLRRLAEAAGRDAVRNSTALPRVAGIAPLAWVEPADAEGVARVLALCTEAEVPVEPAGSGSWLSAGRPGRAAVVVSTRRIGGITEHEPADLVAGVRAGTPLALLQQELSRHDQELALDPAGGEESTVGAVLALGAAGPLRARHGTPRDVVLGAEVVTADGRLLRFGGRVVKNVAGYDVARLLVGSRGTLGIITAAYVLLRALPAADRTLLFAAASAAEAAALALEARAADVADAVEVLSFGGAGWQVAIRLRGSDEAVGAAELELGRRAGRPGAVAGGGFWPALAASEAAPAVYLRLAAPPGELAATLEQALRLSAISASDNAAEEGGGWRFAAHGTTGTVRAWRAEPPPRVLQAGLGDLLMELRYEVGRTGGTATYAVLPAALHERVDAYGPRPEAELALARAVARAFDPADIMSPGRHWK